MRVAIIPARGGSRRIPRKNIRLFHGKPIIAYSIEAAIASRLFEMVYVSTDDGEIAQAAMLYGAEPLRRTADLSVDTIGTQEVVRAELDQLRVGGIHPIEACCIYATAPMLAPSDLVRASQQFWPHIDYVVPCGTWLSDPGQFYFGRTEAFLEERPLLGPWTALMKIDPRRCCDINTPEDWAKAEAMYAALEAARE